MKKDRYKNQQEGENDTEYLDEIAGNCTEDNLAEDADDEGMGCKYLYNWCFLYFCTKFYNIKIGDVNTVELEVLKNLAK